MDDRIRPRQLICGCTDDRHFDTQLLYFTCSSLSADDQRLYIISNRDGHPNVFVKDLHSGEERQLTHNEKGILKSYVYFDGTLNEGLGKASVCLDSQRDIIYFIQDDCICKVGLDGKVVVLNHIPDNRMTAFTHVSDDGRWLCVPMTDGRCLDYDPETEGSGLDKRPIYNIDQRVQEEQLSSYLCVYNTADGSLRYERRVPLCWITHVQFNPADPDIIMYNHEWPCRDCGIRRIWLYNRHTDELIRVRTEGDDTLGNPHGFPRNAADWVCHEMWSDDGNIIIYHGGYDKGPAMVGRYDMRDKVYWEIALPEEYKSYGHFTMNHQQILCCDGYFKFADDKLVVRENSTDNGPDPHKKDGEYISQVVPQWEEGRLQWIPLCKHESDWLGQDAHPHPIYNHAGDRIYFNSRSEKDIKVYYIDVTADD